MHSVHTVNCVLEFSFTPIFTLNFLPRPFQRLWAFCCHKLQTHVNCMVCMYVGAVRGARFGDGKGRMGIQYRIIYYSQRESEEGREEK